MKLDPRDVDAGYYRRVARWSARPAHGAELDTLLDGLDLPPGALVLDAGCGTGAAMPALRARRLRPIGVDLPAAWLTSCAERPVARGDVGTALPFVSASFDGAILMHVLAHIRSPGRALAELHRVLQPGGRLAIMTPNRRYLDAMRLPNRLRGNYLPDPTVAEHFELPALLQHLTDAGFAIDAALPLGKLPWLAPLPRNRERLFALAVKLER